MQKWTVRRRISRFLLTPLREGRPDKIYDLLARSTISTHAPTRGATYFAFPLLRDDLHFYSRPYARGDRYCARLSWRLFTISTHAPTRGATRLTAYAYHRDIQISTHAPTRGATRIKSTTCLRDLPFLLTPLREGRLTENQPNILAALYFYSRPYARGD